MKKSNYQDKHCYDDIIRLPHHVSGSHPPMPAAERAAQFSPFAALTGFEEAVRETGRLTESRAELDEDMKELLNEKLERLRLLQAESGEMPWAAVTYFRPDEKKDGGAYVTVTGQVKRVDEYERALVLRDGEKIPLGEIAGVEEIEDFSFAQNAAKA